MWRVCCARSCLLVYIILFFFLARCGEKHVDKALKNVYKVTSWTDAVKMTWVLHKEIYSLAAFKNLNKLSTGNWETRRSSHFQLQSAHIWPMKKWLIHVNCHKLLHRASLTLSQHSLACVTPCASVKQSNPNPSPLSTLFSPSSLMNATFHLKLPYHLSALLFPSPL